jgi:hypothetical protein
MTTCRLRGMATCRIDDSATGRRLASCPDHLARAAPRRSRRQGTHPHRLPAHRPTGIARCRLRFGIIAGPSIQEVPERRPSRGSSPPRHRWEARFVAGDTPVRGAGAARPRAAGNSGPQPKTLEARNSTSRSSDRCARDDVETVGMRGTGRTALIGRCPSGENRKRSKDQAGPRWKSQGTGPGHAGSARAPGRPQDPGPPRTHREPDTGRPTGEGRAVGAQECAGPVRLAADPYPQGPLESH